MGDLRGESVLELQARATEHKAASIQQFFIVYRSRRSCRFHHEDDISGTDRGLAVEQSRCGLAFHQANKRFEHKLSAPRLARTGSQG